MAERKVALPRMQQEGSEEMNDCFEVKETPVSMVDHPAHYVSKNGVEVIDII